jgi:hypothetical protein
MTGHAWSEAGRTAHGAVQRQIQHYLSAMSPPDVKGGTLVRSGRRTSGVARELNMQVEFLAARMSLDAIGRSEKKYFLNKAPR